MSDFSIVFQINTGSFTNRHYSEDELLENIKRLFSFIKAEKVIMGWFPDSSMYKKAISLIHSYGSEVYLWLPVFADILPSLGIKGISAVTQTASSDEHFEFISPEVGTNHVLTEYRTVADDTQFDGAFLDRIRYGTPSSDVTRNSEITKAAQELVDCFHERGIKVGLDLFAPHLAPFMGQNSELLGSVADFIKPMMYWTTNAPAGIPYEEKVFEKALNKKIFYEDSLLKSLASTCNVYPGIEVNNIPGICCTTPEYVAEKIKLFKKQNCKGAVLSWNTPDATDVMLKAISQTLE